MKTWPMLWVWRTVAACLAMSLAGCTTTVGGTEEKQPGPPPGGVQATLLDPGNFPTKPRPPLGNVKSEFDGRVLEGDRMANNVVLPYEVDASLVKPTPALVYTVKNADALGNLLPNPAPAAAAAQNFIVGFSTGRETFGNAPYKQLTNLVMQFPDPGAAAAAAGDMAAKYASPAPTDLQSNLPQIGSQPQQPFGIPRHPEALGSTSTEKLLPQYGDQTGYVVSAFTAHGKYVLFQSGVSTDNVDGAAEMVARTIDMQGPLIDRFMPAAPSQFAGLPADPTGLLARTLPAASQDAEINQNAVYEPRAALHFVDDPPTVADAFKANGVQNVAIAQTTVYQAIDAAGAQNLADTLATVTTKVESYDKPIAGIDGYPAAKCFTTDKQDVLSAKFYCVAPADRYVIEANGQQDVSTRQQVAAQYLILTSQ